MSRENAWQIISPRRRVAEERALTGSREHHQQRDVLYDFEERMRFGSLYVQDRSRFDCVNFISNLELRTALQDKIHLVFIVWVLQVL